MKLFLFLSVRECLPWELNLLQSCTSQHHNEFDSYNKLALAAPLIPIGRLLSVIAFLGLPQGHCSMCVRVYHVHIQYTYSTHTVHVCSNPSIECQSSRHSWPVKSITGPEARLTLSFKGLSNSRLIPMVLPNIASESGLIQGGHLTVISSLFCYYFPQKKVIIHRRWGLFMLIILWVARGRLT